MTSFNFVVASIMVIVALPFVQLIWTAHKIKPEKYRDVHLFLSNDLDKHDHLLEHIFGLWFIGISLIARPDKKREMYEELSEDCQQ